MLNRLKGKTVLPVIMLTLCVAFLTGGIVNKAYAVESPTPTPTVTFTPTGPEPSTSTTGSTNTYNPCPQDTCTTAIGSVTASTPGIVSFLLKFGIGIGGGLALLMIIIGAYTIMSNPGGPERIKQGKQLIANAVIGLLLLIFSITLLNIIGGSILGIGGLPFGQ